MDDSGLWRLSLGTAIAIWRDRVYEVTEGKRLSQGELQRLAELPGNSMTRIERGSKAPGPEELRRIVRVLKTDVATLMSSADLLFDLLARALGPLRLAEDHAGEPPPASEVTDRGIPIAPPEELRRRWQRLLAAEADLARERHELEYLTRVDASRLGIALGPPRPIT